MGLNQTCPLVSVIIPVYNVLDYLEECVASVLNQKYRNLEIILVDDGSTDGSGNMCDEYAKKDSRIVVVHKANGGLGSARNVGVSLAQGKYIEFLDSDDWITEDTVEYLVQEAEEKNLDLVLFAARSFVDGKEEDIHTGINKYNRSHNFDQVMDGLTCYHRMAECGEYIASSCMRFFSLRFFREQELRFQENIIHEDEDVGFLSVVLAKRVEIVDKRFYQRRYRPGSIMTTKSAVKSLRGYAGAFGGLTEAYARIQPTGALKEAFLRNMEYFLFVVLNAYQNENGHEKRLIRRNTQDFLRKGLKNHIPIDLALKFAEASLPLYTLYQHYRSWRGRLSRFKARMIGQKKGEN